MTRNPQKESLVEKDAHKAHNSYFILKESSMYFLGVDGGGTKTTAVLANENGTVLRTLRTGAGNISTINRGATAQLIREIISRLLQSRAVEQIRWATFAFAGAGRKPEREIVEALIRGAGIRDFSLTTDAQINYYSFFRDQPGILISSGTGSICLVRDRNSKFHQIGGLGYLLGDEGSGFFIGTRAIRAALYDFEFGKEPSRLTRELLNFYGLSSPENLVSMVYSSVNPSHLIASCARLVCEIANAGEPNALKIADEAAVALVDLALQAVQFFKDNPEPVYKMALTGGILKPSSVVHRLFKQKMQKWELNVQYLQQEMVPAAAAVLYSMQACGQSISEELTLKLKQIKFSE